MTSFAEKPIPIAIDEKPRIFFKFNGPEQELEFVAWTTKFLIVMNPSDSLSAGKKIQEGGKNNKAEDWRKRMGPTQKPAGGDSISG